MINLKNHYDLMFHDAVSSIARGTCSVDKLIDDPNDSRFGMIVNIRPSAHVLKNAEVLQNVFRKIDEKQYFYPVQDMHVTVLAIVSCQQGFSLDELPLNRYLEIISEAAMNADKFSIACRGITASAGGIMIQGFPSGNDLEVLRNKLRREFKASSLMNTIDSRYRIATAHSTIIRFRRPLEKTEEWIRTLKAMRDFDFGVFEVSNVELVYSDWYQRNYRSRVLGNFELGSTKRERYDGRSI